MQYRSRLLLPLLPAASFLAAPLARAAAQEPRVEIETSLGKIVVRLAPDRAPQTVKNFLRYVNEGFYNGTIFHRVIPGFMVQGGGFDETLREKPTHEPIPLEARGGLRNDRYTIAMARTSYPHSATSQFYINVAANDFLNADQAQDGNGYCVFGTVISGTDVVDKIAAVPTGSRRGMGDVPVTTVKILSAKVLP